MAALRTRLSQWKHLPAPISALAVLLVAWVILTWNIGGPSYLVDEFTNVEIDRGSLSQILSGLGDSADLHPPVSHFVMAAWIRLVGEREFPVRMLPVMFGCVSLALLFRFATSVLRQKRAWLAIAFLALSPTFVLYARFEKYYAITIAAFLATLVITYTWWINPSRRNTVLIVAITVILLYTDYLAALFASIAVGLLLIILALRARLKGRHGRTMWSWLLIQLSAAVLFIPWLGVLIGQSSQLSSTNADLSGTVASIGLRLAATATSFGIGETLYVWRIWGIVGACAVIVLTVAGIASFKYNRRALLILLTCLLTAIVGGALLTTSVLKAVPFAAFPNHILFALPLVCVLFAYGAWFLPRLPRLLVVSMWCAAALVGLINYQAGQEFLNPIYAVPTREIAQEICQKAVPSALVLAQRDTGLPFYMARLADAPPALEPTAIQTTTAKPAEVWLFTYGRDSTRGVSEADDAAREWLTHQQYQLVSSTSYVPIDNFYANIKSSLLTRPAYTSKATLERWQLTGSATQQDPPARSCNFNPQGAPLKNSTT
jgi:hypothetical protein